MSVKISVVETDTELHISNPEDSGNAAQIHHSPRSPASSEKLPDNEDPLKDKSVSQRIAINSPGVFSAVDGTKGGCLKDNLQICSVKSCESKLSTPKELEAVPLFSWQDDDATKPMLLSCSEANIRTSPRIVSPCVDKKLLELFGSGCNANTQSAQACNNEVNLDRSILSDSLSEQPLKRIKITSEDSDSGILDTKFLMHSLGEEAENSDLGMVDTKFLLMHSQRELTDNQCTSEKIKLLSSEKKQNNDENFCCLIGDPLPSDEAQERWHWRYEMKNQRSKRQKPLLDDDGEDKIIWNVEYHYAQAAINGSIFELGDCAYIKGDGDKKHVGRIIEFFKTSDDEDYFRVQWFYRVEDTVIQEEGAFHDKKRLFYSTVMNDNPIDCIISKVSVVQISPNLGLKRRSISASGYYFDMEYSVEYSSFRTMHIDDSFKKQKSSSSPNVVEPVPMTASSTLLENMPSCNGNKAELSLLDLFSGCGGMSTGLCLGAKASSVDLVTRWALDNDASACESFKLNHPETHVRNEAAQDFLELLKQWEKLCKKYAFNDKGIHKSHSMALGDAEQSEDSSDDDEAPGEYEVSRIVDVCYGDLDKTGNRGLKFKVHWKGYSSSEDTWEPENSLINCQDCVRDFVRCGFKSKILPLPGDVGVICGGPPCQGISGYNRFRNIDSPLSDERNRQIVVFMDIVQFLKPKFVLMENVVDILRFDKASFARYALSRLVDMKYQARLGTMAAGCYGLPQFRLRVFVWGAHPSEKLPPFPLPTHDVIIRYWPPPEFERNTVAYDENQPRELEKAAVLRDAISDLPPVTSREYCEELAIYEKPPETDFQRFIRSTVNEMTGTSQGSIIKIKNLVYDHRPYPLTEDDYARVCLIPKQKGANFRDLPGLIVGSDNVVRRDPKTSQVLPSGKPLVPDFAVTFEQGKSKRPYARVWWDENVSTVVTVPDLHCQIVVHPEQDRVLTIRECARLQGFPDYYRFCGSIKKRYRQIGNAVAVPVGRALGYALGMAFQKLSGDEPLIKLPPKFSYSSNLELAEALSQKKTDELLIVLPPTTNLNSAESLTQKMDENCIMQSSRLQND
ncbi:DNA (cytosine-5)-methyltransferase CMT2 [Euphorbia peplus]|nr:DNA (cytosine-5)-methyltransferase CMT2 [Euphorbia peplus]